MKIAVCIKQVPTVSRMTFDYANKRIIREGVPLEVNPFDVLAVGRAVELKNELGAEVTVLTMGPPQARDALVQCLAMGADHALHLTDRAMAGSDTLATARTLAMALRPHGFDLILCGRNSTDAETGQVGPEVAELLGIPHISRARKLDFRKDSHTVVVERVTDEGFEVIECPLPALVTVTEGISPERFPNREAMAAARQRPITEVSAGQLSADKSLFGAAGSPTVVAEIQLVEPKRLGLVIQETDPAIAAQKVAQGIRDKAAAPVPQPLRDWKRYLSSETNALWVVVEKVGSQFRWVSFELLGKARELAEGLRVHVAAVVLSQVSDDEALTLSEYGADHIYVLGGDKPVRPMSPFCAAALAEAMKRHIPFAVLAPSTADGRDLASRVAARLGLGLTGDCIDLEINANGELVQLKPALGGNVVAPILSKTRPYIATLRPGLLTPVQPQRGFVAKVEHFDGPTPARDPIKLLETHYVEDARGAELERSSVVIGVGKGVGGPENLGMIYEQAHRLGAAVAATRDVTDAGWLPKQLQVGLTGRAIAPRLYVAVGVRGAFNHMVGVQKAGTIVAINNNPRAPIFKGADFAILGDWKTYLPPLVEALKPLVSNQAAGGPGTGPRSPSPPGR